MSDWDPLTAPIPREIPLPNAPLIRVIAQVRFPTIASIERPAALGPFQELIRERYPVLRQEKSQGILLGPGGPAAVDSELIWRFAESSESQTGWGVSLTRNFLALETLKYTSRDDFMARLGETLSALDETFHPPAIDRLGIRYIDRLEGMAVANIATFIQGSVLGVSAMSIGARIRHMVTDSLFDMNGGKLRARWGRLPPMSTFDTSAIEPVKVDSWVLDLDAFSDKKADFDVDHIVGQAREFAERIYAFFRWAVTDDFLRHFGGKL